jgi:hypothetical protein
MAELIDAVNTLLMARGLAPVNSIVSGHPLHASAVRFLERKKEDFCSHRWWFNTEEEVQLSYDIGTGKVTVPSTVMDLDDAIYVIRNGYLYDPEEHTDIFTENPDTVTLIFNTEWEELPTPAFNHIEALAKEEFIRPLNDALKTQQAVGDIRATYARFQIADLRHKDVSVYNNPTFAMWKRRMPYRYWRRG